MKTIVDFHTHIFPDNVAQKAIPYLENEGNVEAFLDGTRQSLLNSMEKCGISTSIICSIATKVSQFEPILDFCKEIQSEKLVPFPSVHPDDPDVVEKIKLIRQEGFLGIKMHPYYQNFYLDDSTLMKIYAEISKQNLILLMHTGFDIAFPKVRRADPDKIIKILDLFPDLKMVTSHFGAWDLWEEVRQKMIGKSIYMDLSFALEFLSIAEAKSMLESHPADYLLFATDSPWAGQKECIELLQGLELSEILEKKILGENALRLLESASC